MFKHITKSIVATLVLTGAAHSQSASADYDLTVDALPAFCTLTNPVNGAAGIWDLVGYTFTNGTTPTVDVDSRDFAYVIVDASNDVAGPGGTVLGAISDVDYNNGLLGTIPVVDYVGGLGDGDAGLVDLTTFIGVTVNDTLSINPFITMDQANFMPQNVGEVYTATFVVTCIES